MADIGALPIGGLPDYAWPESALPDIYVPSGGGCDTTRLLAIENRLTAIEAKLNNVLTVAKFLALK